MAAARFHPLTSPWTPPSGKRAAGVFSRASASVATRFSRCLEPHKCSHNHQSHTCEIEHNCEGCCGGPGPLTMVSPSVSPVRLTSSPLEASPSPSPPKINLGKRSAAAFLKPSVEVKHKPLLMSSPGLGGLNLPSPGLSSSIGISSPSPRILLRPEVAAYLARGRFIVSPVRPNCWLHKCFSRKFACNQIYMILE